MARRHRNTDSVSRVNRVLPRLNHYCVKHFKTKAYIRSVYSPLRTQHGNICTVAFLYLVGKPEDLTKYKSMFAHVFYEAHTISWEPQNFSLNVMVIKSHPFCAQLPKMIRYNLKIFQIWLNQPENIPITFHGLAFIYQVVFLIQYCL